uniref:26S proteasome non-ATPase regulatory subunit 9 n=1 Tax=Anopheles epiroticus TaxID=199890 RepID=A0A182P7J5_9DIPT
MSREALLSLMKRKKDLETQIEQHGLVLRANNIGMNEPLVDDDGYPLSNVDVVAVRNARHAIICLQNDRKAIMKQIENGMTQVFEQERSTNANGQESRQQQQPMEVDDAGVANAPLEPFAVVERVDPGQLADRMGITVGDKVLQVGTVTARNFQTMLQVQSVIQNMQGRSLRLVVRKPNNDKDVVIEVNLTRGSRLGIFMKLIGA